MISAVILTKNEEKNITGCLDALTFCDEIVVVDDKSEDKTVQIAKRKGAKILLRPMDGDFSTQSNFGMANATGDWILFIDADERVSKELANEIKEAVKTSLDTLGFYLRRVDYFLGKKLTYGELKNQKHLRLIKKNTGKWIRRVHPHFDIDGETRELSNVLNHYPHPTVHDFVVSVNRWSSWDAQAKLEEGIKSSIIKIVIWPAGKFINNFFFKMGFLDGVFGAVYAFLMSFHSYLSWSKLWLLQRQKTN